MALNHAYGLCYYYIGELHFFLVVADVIKGHAAVLVPMLLVLLTDTFIFVTGELSSYTSSYPVN